MQLSVINTHVVILRCFKSQLHILDLFRPLSLFPLCRPLKFETLKLFRSERRRCIRHLNVKSSGKKTHQRWIKVMAIFWAACHTCYQVTIVNVMHFKKIGTRSEEVLPEVFLPLASLKSIDIQLLSTLRNLNIAPVFGCTRSNRCNPMLPKLL